VKLMDETTFEQFLASGSTSLSNLVLQNYSKLGMTEKDLIIYLELSMYAQKGIQFPMASNLA